MRGGRVAVKVIGVVMALSIGACGGGDGGGESGAIEAVGTDFAFEPDLWTATAGSSVEVTFENAGSLEHNWAVLASGVTVTSAIEVADEDMLVNVEAAPGATATTQFTIPPAGTYQVVCSVPGHIEAGMVGELRVSE